MYKEILITHNDLDGIGCAIVFRIAHSAMEFNTDYRIFTVSNDEIDKVTLEVISLEKVDKNTKIFFTDIAPSTDVMRQILTKGFSVKLFDHHLSNYPLKELNPNFDISETNVFGHRECGTSLLYKYYSAITMREPNNPNLMFFYRLGDPKTFSLLVETIRLWDTWEWRNTPNNTLSRELNTLYFLLGEQRFCRRYVNKIKKSLDANETQKLIDKRDMEFIRSKLEYEKKVIDSVKPNNVITLTLKGYKTALIVGGRGVPISILADRFLTNHPDYKIFASVKISDGPSIYSFRTRSKDINVAEEFTIPLGGGGHPGAGGAVVRPELRDEIIKSIINEIQDKTENREEG